MGTDGRQVLGARDEPATPAWLRELPALQTWRRVWLQQVYATPADQPMRWRRAAALPPAPWLMRSPYAPEAR
jgi:transposase